jgi:hypothetical protein
MRKRRDLIMPKGKKETTKEVKEVKKVKENVQEIDMQALMEQMKAQLLDELKEQAKKEVEEELKKSEDKTHYVKKDIDKYKPIPIMNVTNGQLIYISKKTGVEISFSDFGDIEYIDYQELLTMRSSQRRFIDEPFILILDDEVVNHLGLTKQYENMKFIKDGSIDHIFRLNQEEFEEILEKAPKGIKHSIITRARVLYETGELYDIRKIRYLNERFNAEIGERG